MNRILISANKGNLRIILIVSVIVPVAVGILLFSPEKFTVNDQSWIRSLPTANALINSTTAVLLLIALWAIRLRKVELHKNLMTAAFVLGTFFLLSYITYHASASSTVFGDIDQNGLLSPQEEEAVSSIRGVYLFTLLSHIALSIVVVPFVLFAFYYSLSGQLDKHRKLVKFTFPIWLYVSISGVLVYLMISPYYL